MYDSLIIYTRGLHVGRSMADCYKSTEYVNEGEVNIQLGQKLLDTVCVACKIPIFIATAQQ